MVKGCEKRSGVKTLLNSLVGQTVVVHCRRENRAIRGKLLETGDGFDLSLADPEGALVFLNGKDVKFVELPQSVPPMATLVERSYKRMEFARKKYLSWHKGSKQAVPGEHFR